MMTISPINRLVNSSAKYMCYWLRRSFRCLNAQIMGSTTSIKAKGRNAPIKNRTKPMIGSSNKYAMILKAKPACLSCLSICINPEISVT